MSSSRLPVYQLHRLQYISFLATSVNQNISLPRLPIFPENYVHINGKKTAHIVKCAACISQHEETGSFLNEILQWPRNFFKE